MDAPNTSEGRSARPRGKPPYFLQPARQGAVTVFRRPCGNRATPKECGTLPNRALALAFIRQLTSAESVADDLFLEATDDGIEALEAILVACRQSVLAAAERRGGRGGRGRGRPHRGGGNGGRA
ncbi:MAG TPA: hypothetical protein VNA89_13210, partial [Gemmatimonadaceae bacterium]|nr:hypothetical protein [Gemmatimonadaceae bacterium]